MFRCFTAATLAIMLSVSGAHAQGAGLTPEIIEGPSLFDVLFGDRDDKKKTSADSEKHAKAAPKDGKTYQPSTEK